MSLPLASAMFQRRLFRLLLAALAVCFLAMLASASRASAQGVTVSFKFYNTTGQVITSASAGSTVRMVAVVVVPDAATDAKVTINATAKLKILGISAPYKIPMANVDLPNANPQDGGALLQNGTQQGEFKIPSSTPTGSSIRVSAQATVAGLTSNVVNAKLTVR